MEIMKTLFVTIQEKTGFTKTQIISFAVTLTFALIMFFTNDIPKN